eukprot:766482-Hanusia_phi.AAC.2
MEMLTKQLTCCWEEALLRSLLRSSKNWDESAGLGWLVLVPPCSLPLIVFPQTHLLTSSPSLHPPPLCRSVPPSPSPLSPRLVCQGLVDHWDNTGPRVSDIVPYSPAGSSRGLPIVLTVTQRRQKSSTRETRLSQLMVTPEEEAAVWDLTVCPRGGCAGVEWRWKRSSGWLITDCRSESKGSEDREEADGRAGAEACMEYDASCVIRLGDWVQVRGRQDRRGGQCHREVGVGAAACHEGETDKVHQNGWEKTSKGAKEVAKSINESTTSASETMTEAGEKVLTCRAAVCHVALTLSQLKEAVVVDTAARKRIAELEEENRILREKSCILPFATTSPPSLIRLGQAASSGSNTPSAQ